VTRRPTRGTGNRPAETADGWRACVPELTLTAALVLVTSAAVYGYAGAGAAVLTLTIWAVVLLVLARGLVTGAGAPLLAHRETWRGAGRTSFTGFWRKRGVLANATASMASYDAELRPILQHLLAARLAERHDVNLYQDPATARQLLLGGATRSRREDQLWRWLDPARPAEARQQVRGIPPRTLAAIIDRLERL
jgi:hypothetical protein